MTNRPSNPPPAVRLSQMLVSLWIPQAIHTAAELGLADVLAHGPGTAAAVAEALGTDPDATARLLSALVVLGFLQQHDAAFSLTELGRCLVADDATSLRAWARLMGGADVWSAWGRLTDCVRTGKSAWARADGPSGGRDVFDAMSVDGRSAAIFHRAMLELTRTVAPGIVGAVDWTGVRRVVDVGGGYGALLAAILDARPSIEGSVFDLVNAKDGALAHFAERGLASRAAFVVGSFFDGPLPAADVLIMKSVIHDWSDEKSLTILARCREAMDDDTRLLVVEPPTHEHRTGTPHDRMMAFSDLNMLVNTGGRERTEDEYRALLERAGHRVVAVLGTTSFFRVFEARRA